MIILKAASLILFVADLFSATTIASADDIQWHDGASLGLEGAGWTDAQSAYDRFPARAQGIVPEGVWYLSTNSAGVCIRFVTNAKIVSVRWDLTNDNLAMPHMPATGVSGVDLYCRMGNGTWRFVMNGRPEKANGNLASGYLPDDRTKPTECLLYLPLYNGVKKLEIGVPSDCTIGKADDRPKANRLPIVYYGTSITQGGCASRPGMAFTAIIGRALNRPVVNLGFSGSGRMEPSVTELIAELDPSVYVVDCLWNVGDLSDEELTTRLKTLVANFRKRHPQTPILFVGQSLILPQGLPTAHEKLQDAVVESLHDANIHVCPGRDLMGFDGEGTVDGCHPNDLGMMRQSTVLIPILKRLTRGK